jgi:IS4 transposase
VRLNHPLELSPGPKGLSRSAAPDQLCRTGSGQALVFLTNQFELAALVIAKVYRRRWSMKLLWRWLKQHLRLRGFFSNDSNGVRVQIWTALCAYLLVAIAKEKST